MAVIAGLLLVVFCIGVALYPFIRPHAPDARARRPASSIVALAERRREIYADLETLDLELGLGQVDEAEYQERARDYRMAAAATFRDQERLESSSPHSDQAVDRELLHWRARRQATSPTPSCPACGRQLAGPGEPCPACNGESGA